jgi:hypothetical protein
MSSVTIIFIAVAVATSLVAMSLSQYPPGNTKIRVEQINHTLNLAGATGPPGEQGPMGLEPSSLYAAPSTETLIVKFGGTAISTVNRFSIGYGPNGFGIRPLFVWFSGSASWPDLTGVTAGAMTIQTSLVRTTTDVWPITFAIGINPSMPAKFQHIVAVSDPSSSANFQVYLTHSDGSAATPLQTSDISVGGILVANNIVFQGFFPTT